LQQRQTIVLYASHTHFSTSNVVPGLVGDGVGGVTEHAQGRIALPFAVGLGTDAGSALLIERQNGGRLNVGLALSPNGTSVTFLSDRDGLSISVQLADATTGIVKRTIVHTAGDPHFESLQFIESAGAWDPSGRRVAAELREVTWRMLNESDDCACRTATRGREAGPQSGVAKPKFRGIRSRPVQGPRGPVR
jgi:hypothetical protein